MRFRAPLAVFYEREASSLIRDQRSPPPSGLMTQRLLPPGSLSSGGLSAAATGASKPKSSSRAGSVMSGGSVISGSTRISKSKRPGDRSGTGVGGGGLRVRETVTGVVVSAVPGPSGAGFGGAALGGVGASAIWN